MSRMFLPLLGSVAVAAFAQSASAQIVPSGATATHAAPQSNGHIVVNIAPANRSNVSLNQYSNFSVPTVGAELLNTGVNANTIINQVTSANRSYLYGALSVTGPAANVIVVNPNGITVNGGSFVNTGGVALSTGSISYQNSATAPGFVNTVVSTGSADILVTGAGLAGSMSTLQLVAGSIKIDGSVKNASSDPNATIETTAGNANVMLDSSLTPGATLTPWATKTDLGGTSNSILIDVTPNGSLSASRIHMSVGAKGAGVSFAGNGNASIGEFTITAGGKVSVLGGSITTTASASAANANGASGPQNSVKIVAQAIDVLNANGSGARLSSVSGGVTLLANGGDINITGQISGDQRDGADHDSLGGVTLNASGSISLLSQNANNLAIVFSANDTLSVTAGGSIINDTGRFLSNNPILINTGGSFSNNVDVVGATNALLPSVNITKGRSLWWWPWIPSVTTTLTWNEGALRIPGQLAYVEGSEVFINAASVANSGAIYAQGGPMEINTGAFLDQGFVTGQAEYSKFCDIVCKSGGWSTAGTAGDASGGLSGAIFATGAMAINASTSIVNSGGTILSDDNMQLNAPTIALNGVYSPQIGAFPGGLYNFFSGRTAFVYEAPGGGQFVTPYGDITVPNSASVAIDGGAFAAAFGVINSAGQLVTATNTIAADAPMSDLPSRHIGVLRHLW
jgi:filamentous hemagglutinin family protein